MQVDASSNVLVPNKTRILLSAIKRLTTIASSIVATKNVLQPAEINVGIILFTPSPYASDFTTAAVEDGAFNSFKILQLASIDFKSISKFAFDVPCGWGIVYSTEKGFWFDDATC